MVNATCLNSCNHLGWHGSSTEGSDNAASEPRLPLSVPNSQQACCSAACTKSEESRHRCPGTSRFCPFPSLQSNPQLSSDYAILRVCRWSGDH